MWVPVKKMAIKKHALKNCYWRYFPWFAFVAFILMISFSKNRRQRENSSLLKIRYFFPFIRMRDVSSFVDFPPLFFLSWFACQEHGVNSILITVNSSLLVWFPNFRLVPTNFKDDPGEEAVIYGEILRVRLGVSQDPKSSNHF